VAQFYKNNRVNDVSVEGENHIQRMLRFNYAFLPAVTPYADLIYNFPFCTLQFGSWTIGGTEYSMLIVFKRHFKSYGRKVLNGPGPPGAIGIVHAAGTAAGIPYIHCKPGWFRAENKNSTAYTYFQATGNVAELPMPLRPQSRGAYGENLIWGDVHNKAYAGDVVQFLTSSLQHQRFCIYTALPCDPSGPNVVSALPTDVDLPAIDSSYLLRADKLTFYDFSIAGSGVLASAIASGEVGEGTLFTVENTGLGYPGFGFVWQFAYAERKSNMSVVALSNVLSFTGTGYCYVKKSWVDTLNVAKEYCFRIYYRGVGGP